MKVIRIVGALVVLVALVGYFVPASKVIPVQHATSSDWNKDSFWFDPWGSSGVHKGIDIFAKKGTYLNSTTPGIVLYHGSISKGGNVVLILSPKGHLHYYAHLESVTINGFDLVNSGEQIGTVGDSGNARGKPAHVHYSIVTIVPYPWLITRERQGWKRMFYLDPGQYLKHKSSV